MYILGSFDSADYIHTHFHSAHLAAVFSSSKQSFPPLPPQKQPQLDLTEESITQTNRHSLRLSIIRQCSLTQLTTNTALLVATEWQGVMQHIVLVDPDGTGAEGIGDTDSGVEV